MRSNPVDLNPKHTRNCVLVFVKVYARVSVYVCVCACEFNVSMIYLPQRFMEFPPPLDCAPS